jgi:hypothetical protein
LRTSRWSRAGNLIDALVLSADPQLWLIQARFAPRSGLVTGRRREHTGRGRVSLEDEEEHPIPLRGAIPGSCSIAFKEQTGVEALVSVEGDR